MSRDTAWTADARQGFEGGMSVRELAAAFGRSEYMIRRQLNINGMAERAQQANVENRTGPRSKYVVSSRRSRTGQVPTTTIAPSTNVSISLPALSFLSKPFEEPKPALRFAPKTHCRVEKPGVARWRDKHRELIRAGKVSAPDMEMIS